MALTKEKIAPLVSTYKRIKKEATKSALYQGRFILNSAGLGYNREQTHATTI